MGNKGNIRQEQDMSITAYIEATRAEIDKLIAHARPYIENHAAEELARRRGELLCSNLAEFVDVYFNWLGERSGFDREHEYRRGYHDGFGQALDDVRTACRPSRWQTLAQFFDNALSLWRYGDQGGIKTPPQAPASAKPKAAA
jgi:hypothetical protein